jgi:hypothetical protein
VDIGPTGPSGTLGIDGVTGPTGPVGIGIGTTLKGAWVAGQAYSTNSGTNPDAVTYNGSLYICLDTVSSSVTPDQDPTKWQLYVRQGGTGPSGPPGASGLTGVTGLKGDTGFTGPSGATGLKGDTGSTGPAGNISSVGSDGQLLYNRGGALGATGSMMFRSTGPTGPLGQATGPIGQPTLQLGAYLLPTTDATYDLGATGIQFKDVHFSGSLYNNGVPFSGGGGAVSGLTYRATGPTGPQGQATGPAPNPTLQMAAYLIPTTDATYDLGATGIRFKDEFLSGSLYMGATGATGVNILQTGLIPSHILEDTTTGPTLNYSQTMTKPGLYTTTAIYGSLPPPENGSQVTYAPRVILNSARGYATGPTSLTNGDILGAVLFNENNSLRAYVASIKSGATETEHVSLLLGTTTGGGNSQIIINSTGPTGPTGDPTGPEGKNIGLNAHMYPMNDAIYNLGATGYQFKDVHFSGTIYNNGTAFQGGVSGLTYRATGPTGPDGQATGPTGPTLQINAHLVPTEDLIYDLGATGLRFRDLYVGGTSIHIGDNIVISSTNDGLSVADQNNSLSLIETIDASIPEINSNALSSGGSILSVVNSSNGTYISISFFYYNSAGTPCTAILSSNDGGITMSETYSPVLVTDNGPIASVAMTPSGQYQVAVLGAKAPWPIAGFTGPIIRSSNYGATWAALDTDSPTKLRQYTSVSISSDGARIVATHLSSGTGGTAVNPGFVYTVNANAESPEFTKVTDYTVPGGSSTNFTAPRFINIYQDGTRFIVMDVRTSAVETDVICFDMTSGTPTCLIKLTFSSLNILVSNLTSSGFTVLYNVGTSGSWAHTFKRYNWSVSSNTPTLNSTTVVYSDTTDIGIVDLQLLCSADGTTQLILPTYTSSARNITNGLYISNNTGASWQFLDHANEGIVTNNTTNVTSIALTSSNIYRFLYNSVSGVTKLYKSGQKYIVKNGTGGLNYLPFGPTGPTGQATGPTGSALQLSANILPTQDLAYDLGATGLRFRDLFVGGTSIHMGDNVTISSTNDGLSVSNQYISFPFMEKILPAIPEINSDIISPNRGVIVAVANSTDGTCISISATYLNTYWYTNILSSTNGGVTTAVTYSPVLVSDNGPIASLAMTPSGQYQVAVFGAGGLWPNGEGVYIGTIKRSSNSGATWATINTDSPTKLRRYTSVSISSSGGRIVATHLSSGTGGNAVNPGFVYTVNANAESPEFTNPTSYTPPGGSSTDFTAPRFVSIDQTGTRFVIMDVVDANTTDIICFNIVSGTAICAGKFTYINEGPIIKNIIVSNVTSAGFKVKYTSGVANNWNHYIDTYIWSNISITPLKSEDLTENIYIDTTETDSTDLQLISSDDGLTQVLLPRYTSDALSVTDGIHISYDSGTSWTFLDNASNGIATSATKNVTAIALTDTGIYSFVYDSSAPNKTKLYKQEFKRLYSNEIINVKNGTSGLNYVPLGPTGPTGQPTGPTGPTLQLSAAILPTQDLTYDLGAAGLRFRDLYVGGSSIHLGDSMNIKSTSGDFTVEYQPNNNTSIGATLIQTTTSSLIATLIASDIASTNGGEILSVVAGTGNNYILIAVEATIDGDLTNYILLSDDGGVSSSISFEPQAIDTGGQITSMAMSANGTLQLAVFGVNRVGYIQYSSNSGTSWAPVSTQRKYTGVTISANAFIMAATYSSSTSPTVLAGFVYSTDFVNSQTVTPVTYYGALGTTFTAPNFTTLGSEGRRLIVVDVRAGQSDVICFDMDSGSPEYVTTITFNSTSIIVSKLGEYTFSVLYKEGSVNNWSHMFNTYRWSYSAEPTPVLAYSATIYTDTTESGITDLQLLYSLDGLNQVVLPTYTVGSEAITDGVYISNNSGINWRFLSNSDQSIPTTTDALTTVKAIALDSANTGIYNFLYDTSADPDTINIYKGVLPLATYAIIKNGLTGLTYVPSPESLEISAPIIPALDATHDLGATGYQFRDIFFSGTLYNGITPFSSGIIAPTDNFMVAGGNGVGLAYSYDGTNWTSVTQTDIQECTAVAWNGLIWVAGITSGGNAIAYSSDGINWSLSSQAVLGNCLAVAWNGSIWLAGGTSAGGGNAIAYSYDGINWTASPQTVISGDNPNGGPSACRALAWNGLIWVAGASATNKMAYSVDGINWTASESANTEFTEGGQCNCVAWNGTMWVAGGQSTVDGGTAGDGVILYSYDGMNWIPANYNGNVELGRYYTIAWNGSLWVAGGTGGKQPLILQSSDGIMWDATTDTMSMLICRSITWNGTMWLAAGEAGSGILANSTDGLTWTAITYEGFTGVAYTVASRRVLPFVGTGGSMPGLYYRASGPTGPTGGQTGPTGPWLQVSANIVPVADNVFDLGATGLRFRDIHVGGSTIYLGDSVSIKADNQGALSVTNNAGTVNLVTPTGLNGGMLSGVGPRQLTGGGTSWEGEGTPYSDTVTFSTPFTNTPVVVVNCTNSYYTSAFDTFKVVIYSVSVSNFVVYGNSKDATYNWIATARTDYPFEFYNEATPITLVTANPTSLVLSVNTSQLLRGGVLPYTGVEIQAFTGGGNPEFTAVPITINTGVQTITINELIADQPYSIYITATDSSASPVTITSDPQAFSTIPIPPITAAVLALVDGTTTSTGVQCEVITAAEGGIPPYTYTIAINPQQGTITPESYVNELGIFTITDLNPDTEYSLILTTTDSMGSTADNDPGIAFTTNADPLVPAVIALGTITEQNRTNSQLPFVISENASGGSGNLMNTWQSKESSASVWTDDAVSSYLLDVTIGTTYNVRIMTTDGGGSTVYSNVITATLYATLTIGDGSVYFAQPVEVGQVVTINIATGNLFDGGIGPYSFTVYDLTQAPANFVLNLTDSQISDNTVSITSTTYSFSQEQTTYLTSNSKTLVYKWTSSGDPGTYPYYLELTSADGQTYNNTQSPFSFTLVEPAQA